MKYSEPLVDSWGHILLLQVWCLIQGSCNIGEAESPATLIRQKNYITVTPATTKWIEQCMAEEISRRLIIVIEMLLKEWIFNFNFQASSRHIMFVCHQHCDYWHMSIIPGFYSHFRTTSDLKNEPEKRVPFSVICSMVPELVRVKLINVDVCTVSHISVINNWLGQWPTFKLLGDYIFNIGKIKCNLLFHGPLAE